MRWGWVWRRAELKQAEIWRKQDREALQKERREKEEKKRREVALQEELRRQIALDLEQRKKPDVGDRELAINRPLLAKIKEEAAHGRLSMDGEVLEQLTTLADSVQPDTLSSITRKAQEPLGSPGRSREEVLIRKRLGHLGK